uniref:Uncharacterized protein n=1 Tax=Pipistrellus kuhlii TaxID=59472 RepID=A0A7J7RH17_PIPKU|nr:hypothetical protein mPipKuh1_010544 [Pipistrellus kuhlii]
MLPEAAKRRLGHLVQLEGSDCIRMEVCGILCSCSRGPGPARSRGLMDGSVLPVRVTDLSSRTGLQPPSISSRPAEVGGAHPVLSSGSCKTEISSGLLPAPAVVGSLVLLRRGFEAPISCRLSGGRGVPPAFGSPSVLSTSPHHPRATSRDVL